MIAAACPGANMVVQNKYASRKPIFMSWNPLHFFKHLDDS